MTNLVRRNNDLLTFRDSFFDNFFSNIQRQNQFSVDIKENESNYELVADLPGFKKEDLNVSYDDKVLTIEAVHNEEKEEKNEERTYIRREISNSSFRCQFLIKDLDRENIKAKFKDGLLSLELPKIKEQLKESNKIEIE